MNEPIFATTAEYAAHRGVTPRMVSKYKKAGRLVLDEDGRIVIHASDARLDRTLHPSMGGNRSQAASPAKTPREGESLPRRPPPGEQIDLAAETARERRAKADLAELELAAKRRELVARTDVESLVRSLAVAAREALLALPGRIAAELALLGDADAMERKLTEELALVCRTMQGSVDDAAVLHNKAGRDSLPASDGMVDCHPGVGDDLQKPELTV